jgi:Tfp pilus assembly protein PilF
MTPKNNPSFLLLLTVVLAASIASGQKRMQVTIVNDSPEAIIGVNVMTGSIVTGSFRKLKPVLLSAPVRAGGRSNVTFDAEAMQPTVVEGRNFYGTKYAVEILWVERGCKKILELNYELSAQSVNAGAKQCGLYKFEVAEMASAKSDAERYYREKNYSLAEEYYSRILKIDPQNEHALHRRGHAWAAMKKHAEAAADFTAAIPLSTDPAHLYGDRGNAYYGAADYSRAAADFEKAFELAPKSTLHLKNRWAALCRSGKTELANAEQKRLLELGVTLPSACEEWVRQFKSGS